MFADCGKVTDSRNNSRSGKIAETVVIVIVFVVSVSGVFLATGVLELVIVLVVTVAVVSIVEVVV